MEQPEPVMMAANGGPVPDSTVPGYTTPAGYNKFDYRSGGVRVGAQEGGSLINQIIQSTSKAFDKPKRTKDAIDTLILKGEIEKDIKASDPTAQQKAKLTEKQIQIADKTLAGDSFSDIITERYKKSKVPRGEELAGILRATEKVDVTTIDSTKIPTGVPASLDSCLLYTSPSPRDRTRSRMPSSA